MYKLNLKSRFGFTLVELVIVIWIVMILWTTWILLLNKWLWNSRDTKRLSDKSNIMMSMDMYRTSHKRYILPDDYTWVIWNWWTLWYQWIFWESVMRTLDTFDKEPKDPSTKDYYKYSVSNDKKEYQIMILLENQQTYNSILNNKVEASDQIVDIDWNYDWYISTKVSWQYYIWNTPSLFVDINNYTWNLVWWKFVVSGDVSTILDNQSTEIATWWEILYVDVTNLKDWLSDGTDEINDIKTKFSVDQEKAVELLNSILWIDVTNVSNLWSWCQTTTYDWYNIPTLEYWKSWSWVKTWAVSNWQRTYTISVMCNNWTFVYWNELVSVTCDTWYVEWANYTCIQDTCGWTITDANWHSTATMQLNTQTWHRSWTAWVCTWDCNSGYHRENNQCTIDTKAVSCGWIISNAVYYNSSSTWYDITQTWNGSSRTPSTWWTYNATPSNNSCEYKCASGYSWNTWSNSCIQIVVNQWTALANYPISVTWHGYAPVWNNIYVVWWNLIPTVNVYDVTTNTWSAWVNLPMSSYQHWLASIWNKIYLAWWFPCWACWSYVPVYEFDTTNPWAWWVSKAQMNTPRGAIAIASLDGKIYTAWWMAWWWAICMSNFERYDPTTNTWTTLANVPRWITRSNMVWYNWKIYIFWGRSGCGNNNQVSIYDVATNTWSLWANMPVWLESFFIWLIWDKVYLAWWRQGASLSSATYEYNITTNTWTQKANMANPRWAYWSSSVINGKMYIVWDWNKVDVYEP